MNGISDLNDSAGKFINGDIEDVLSSETCALSRVETRASRSARRQFHG
jgi:hypothetical protein